VSEKETAIVTEESFAVGDVARWDYIVVKLTEKERVLITQLK
jgi:hypothetical protein